MYIPSPQYIITAGLGFLGTLTDRKSTAVSSHGSLHEMGFLPDDLALLTYHLASTVVSGECLDYAVPKCLDDQGNTRCTKPFLAHESTCYNIQWTTDGVLAHTTAEVRDGGSGELVYYADVNGEWIAKKTELVYLDFKPKIIGQENNTVKYEVTTCT